MWHKLAKGTGLDFPPPVHCNASGKARAPEATVAPVGLSPRRPASPSPSRCGSLRTMAFGEIGLYSGLLGRAIDKRLARWPALHITNRRHSSHISSSQSRLQSIHYQQLGHDGEGGMGGIDRGGL